MQYHVLEVGLDGHLTRCEYEHVDRLPPPGFACSCDVLKGIDFGAASAPRRATVYIAPYRTEHHDGYARSLYVSGAHALDDATGVLGEVNLPVDASKCLASVATVMSLEVPIQLSIGPDGIAREGSGHWPASLPANVRSCLDGELKQTSASCPRSGHATVAATLHVSVAKY
jgi:hypothetical protein